ncbi:MAG: formylmethanofuran dehydrogenase subunit E family protein [Thermoplasmatota archaeon]
MDDTLRRIERFHGHLGPYVVIGYRMGLLSNQILGDNPFAKSAVTWTGTTPPVSCIIDGIQLSSGCTLGKGNITVHDGGIPAAQFTDPAGTSLRITLKPAVRQEIESQVTEDNMGDYSADIYSRHHDQLFDVSIEKNECQHQ